MADDPSEDGGGAHRARLESDRSRAGDLVRSLAPRLADELGGSVRIARGGFDGCRGRTPEGFSAVEYGVTARVDAGPGAPGDLLEPVPGVLAEADDVVTSQVPGGRRVSATSGELTVTVTSRPEAGSFLVVAVRGGCHDIPADEQDDWLGRGVDDLT